MRRLVGLAILVFVVLACMQLLGVKTGIHELDRAVAILLATLGL